MVTAARRSASSLGSSRGCATAPRRRSSGRLDAAGAAMNVEEGSPAGNPNSEGAGPEDELRAYYARKRPMAVWTLALVLPASLALAAVSPVGAVSLVVGAICGLVNAFLSMRSNERLAVRRNVGA